MTRRPSPGRLDIMTRAFCFLTRRQALALPLAALATPALARGRQQDFETRLAELLTRLPSGRTPAELTLCRFDAGADACSAVIRLDWPPGMRQRRFAADGGNTETAFLALLAEIETYFGVLV